MTDGPSSNNDAAKCEPNTKLRFYYVSNNHRKMNSNHVFVINFLFSFNKTGISSTFLCSLLIILYSNSK